MLMIWLMASGGRSRVACDGTLGWEVAKQLSPLACAGRCPVAPSVRKLTCGLDICEAKCYVAFTGRCSAVGGGWRTRIRLGSLRVVWLTSKCLAGRAGVGVEGSGSQRMRELGLSVVSSGRYVVGMCAFGLGADARCASLALSHSLSLSLSPPSRLRGWGSSSSGPKGAFQSSPVWGGALSLVLPRGGW